MKKLSLMLLTLAISISMAFSQNQKEEIENRHSFGSSLFLLYNFTEESADYYLFTYGYQLTKKDRIFVDTIPGNTKNPWEPMEVRRNFILAM